MRRHEPRIAAGKVLQGPGASLLNRDLITLALDQALGEPLLVTVMQDGQRVDAPASLESLRQNAATNLARSPRGLCSPVGRGTYNVEIAPSVRALAAELDNVTTGPRPNSSPGKTGIIR